MQSPAVRPDDQAKTVWWHSERSAITFRFSWLRLYAVMAAWEALLILVIALVQGHVSGIVFSGLLLMALLLDLLAALAMALTFTVRVGESGLQGHDFWGNRTRVRWEDIESVTSSRMLGLPWLRLRARGQKRVLWLPLFFGSRRGFYETVARFAPSSPILPAIAPAERAATTS